MAYFEATDSMGDNYQFFDGEETQKQKVIFQYADKEIGREFMLTEDRSKYIEGKHLPKEKIEAAMRSIRRFGESADNPGQMMAECDNGVVLIFRDNAVYNAYIPDSKSYFKDHTTKRMRKWTERLRSLFKPAGFTR